MTDVLRGGNAPLQYSDASSLRLGMPKPATSNPPEPATEATPEAEAPHRECDRPAQGANEGSHRTLVEQSTRLFQEKDCGDITVRDIAVAMGVYAGSWFYYFKTKQDILRAMIEHGLTVALADIEAVDIEDLFPCEVMRQFVHAHPHMVPAPYRDFTSVMLYEWRSLNAQAQERIVALKDRYEGIWTRVIGRLRASDGWAHPISIDRLLILGALSWMAQWYQAGAGISIDALADQAVLFILRTPSQPAA